MPSGKLPQTSGSIVLKMTDTTKIAEPARLYQPARLPLAATQAPKKASARKGGR